MRSKITHYIRFLSVKVCHIRMQDKRSSGNIGDVISGFPPKLKESIK